MCILIFWTQYPQLFIFSESAHFWGVFFSFVVFHFTGSIDEDVVVIEASSTPQVPANNEEINVTSTDSEVEIVTVGETYRLEL